MRNDIQLFWNVLLKSYQRAPHVHYKIYQDHCKYYREEEKDDSTRPVSRKAKDVAQVAK